MRATHFSALVIARASASAFAFGFGETGDAAEHPAFAQGSGGAGQPRVQNGRLTSQPAGTLDATFRRLVAAQAEPGWIGYSVPVVARSEGLSSGETWISDGMVFTNGRLATCGLEPSTSTTRRPADQAVQVRPPDGHVVDGERARRARLRSGDEDPPRRS